MEAMRVVVKAVAVEDGIAVAKVTVRSRRVIRGRPAAVMEITVAFEAAGIKSAGLTSAARDAALDYLDVELRWSIPALISFVGHASSEPQARFACREPIRSGR